MIVRNVIKGYLSQEDIERVTIINPDSEDIAIYAGTLDGYMNPNDLMSDYKKEVDNMEVKKSAINCGCQLFIIV